MTLVNLYAFCAQVIIAQLGMFGWFGLCAIGFVVAMIALSILERRD